ncbi:MAG: ABC transporter permease [Proteobacteria bacterium]|nr:ABC transporter permease [Pseudomonadota bacterium]
MAAGARWRSFSLAGGFAFLYVPILWIIVYSFSAATVVGVWKGFSWRWYAGLLDNEDFRLAAERSLLLAVVAATLATALGTLAGYALARGPRVVGRRPLAVLLGVPLFVPEILVGFSLLLLFVALESVLGVPVGKGLVPLVAAHATLGLPVVASVVYARLAGTDRHYEEAALDLGARPPRVFLTVTLPLLRPALASGWMLAFTLSFDDVVTSSFLAGPSATTLPLFVYSSIRIGVTPEINAVGTLIVVTVAACVVIAMLRGRLAAQARLPPARDAGPQ